MEEPTPSVEVAPDEHVAHDVTAPLGEGIPKVRDAGEEGGVAVALHGQEEDVVVVYNEVGDEPEVVRALSGEPAKPVPAFDGVNLLESPVDPERVISGEQSSAMQVETTTATTILVEQPEQPEVGSNSSNDQHVPPLETSHTHPKLRLDTTTLRFDLPSDPDSGPSDFLGTSQLQTGLPPSATTPITPLITLNDTQTYNNGSHHKRRASYEEFIEAPDPFMVEESAAYKAARSASAWNGLLRWARKGRGPQWDWATGMYHVDKSSDAYFAGVTRINDASALPAHLQSSAMHAHSPGASFASTPGGTTGFGLSGTTISGLSGSSSSNKDAGVYESGRPRRTRAAMGLR